MHGLLMELIYEGKAKLMYRASDDTLIMRFKDEVTALDGTRREYAPGKGRLAASQSAFFFRLLEGAGVRTHFIDWNCDRDIKVRRLRMIPLEVVVRNYAYGSLLRRMPLLKPLSPLPNPIVEFHYKSDELHDPLVLPEDIVAAKIMDRKDLDSITYTSLRINDLLTRFMGQRGLVLIDLKLEYGYLGSELLVADEISGDTMRVMCGGRHLDKEVFRRGGGVGDLVAAYEELNGRLGVGQCA
jgi:phosphoribosylaminoimidazole-succinocarboxamide synthase